MQISNNKYNIFILVIAIIYLLDQRINSVFNTNGIGFILILFILFFLNKFYINKNYIIYIIIAIIYLILSLIISPCNFTVKTILSVILLPFLIALIIGGYLNNIIFDKYISNFIMIAGSLSLIISAGLDQLIFLDRIARFYYEYSHVALYIMPIIMYRLFCNYKDKIAWFSIFIISIFSFSTTFFFGLLCSLFFIIKIYKLKIIPILLILPLITFGFLFNDHVFDRLLGLFYTSSSYETNISSLVWLNGFSMANTYAITTNGLGIGFNQMGCNNTGDIGIHSALITTVNNGTLLNFEDGSFAFSKIVSELGFLGLFLTGALTFYSLNVFYRAFKEKELKKINFLILAGAISTLICLYVRSAGYYQLHFIIALSMLLSQRIFLR
jgi:hypothetical protein